MTNVSETLNPNELEDANALKSIIDDAMRGYRDLHEGVEVRVYRCRLSATLDQGDDVLIHVHEGPVNFDEAVAPIRQIGSIDTHCNRARPGYGNIIDQAVDTKLPFDALILTDRSSGRCLGYAASQEWIDRLNAK